MSGLMTIVRSQGTARRQNDQHEDEDEDEESPLEREKQEQEKQNGRERVVLLMHETRVLTASDATRVLLLLAREVRLVIFQHQRAAV